MKILFISDIHGVYKNIERIIELDRKEKFDKIICLGDLYSNYYDNVDDVLINKFLKDNYIRLNLVKGNCDSSNETIIDSLTVEGITIYYTHGHKYNYYTGFDHDNCLLVYGHEHIPYIRKKNNTYYICVGSISKPRNEFGCSYGIYNNKNFTLYNIDNEIIDTINL